MQDYSVQDLERLIRHGVRPDGTSVIVPMPATMFYHLSDEDLGAIIAFLKSQQPGDEPMPATQVGPLGRFMFFYYRSLVGTILSAEISNLHAYPGNLASAATHPQTAR